MGNHGEKFFFFRPLVVLLACTIRLSIRPSPVSDALLIQIRLWRSASSPPLDDDDDDASAVTPGLNPITRPMGCLCGLWPFPLGTSCAGTFAVRTRWFGDHVHLGLPTFPFSPSSTTNRTVSNGYADGL